MKSNFIIVGVVTVCSLLTTPTAAANGFIVAGQALGIYATYKQTLTEMLRLGNDAGAQIYSRWQDLKENGVDPNEPDQAVVNKVMDRLTKRGNYVLKVNSLPFIWAVNNDSMFNASCYPTNYISVNRGLVRGLNWDEDELAAVMAHEMIHGLEQHSAHKYAEAAAQILGMNIIAMETGQRLDWKYFQGLIGYSVSKDIMSPAELEADEGGFWLMISAGFNPGGAAAAMARMGDYLRYRTENIYEFDSPNLIDNTSYSDHPPTEEREKRLGELMTLYSLGHVKVTERRNVWLDGELIYTATPDSDVFINSVEKAYYVGGGLAKAFHDLPTAAAWNFRQTGRRTEFLTNDPVYQVLQEEFRSDGQKLAQSVAKAYLNEKSSSARSKLVEAEAKLQEKLNKTREKVLAADKNAAAHLRENSDLYVELGFDDLAAQELDRAMNHPAQDSFAECYTIAGRIRAMRGDYAGGIAEADRGVAMGGTNYMNYLNRADIYRAAGDFNRAVEDAERARAIKEDELSLSLCATIYDEAGRADEAKELYAKLYDRRRDSYIPLNYLEKIDPEEAKKRREYKK